MGRAQGRWHTRQGKRSLSTIVDRRLRTVPIETREFLAVVRKAKKEYWANRINNITTDEELYSLLGWHKLTLGQQDIPLIVNNQTISDPLEKAEALRVEILDRFSAEDDLPEPVWPTETPAGTLPWDTHIPMEEVERSTIGVSSTSPGTDRITVRLLKTCWA
ncbi:hypothetical protein PtrM4_074010 [Pyrenophora tritici-repentis]|uniref:Uncharacterized protein n=1 Tax=Pyrenophora tritici-repentis TaxID=45151 RepID=A0A834VPW0_9PLEO|nr:hypothetical protein PtrM4_151740 [Pyrenophora tritici-repentis]KAF7572496.1 hypothetical protein PtrM4_074010 [Pyrenophora tritici-repentis]KAI1676763.1 hypothetical protein KJE20_13526 [Pyrenophora tritici-repentis]